MKNVAQIPRMRETMRGLISPFLIFSILALLAMLVLGVVIGKLNPAYSVIIAGPIIIGIIMLLRLDELTVTLIVAVHILLDSYLGVGEHQIALAMALVLLGVCWFGRSADHPWKGPRWLWLWILFFILTIYPAIRGSSYQVTDALNFYLNLVLSAFLMFWLGNIIAKDMSAVRRVFQALSVLATFFAVHTIIEAITGTFLFESAAAQANLVQSSNFQLQAGVARIGSFFENPDGNASFLAPCFFLPLGLFIESERFWAKVIYILEMLLILLALLFTYSNAGWIAALVGVLAFVFLSGRIRYSVLLLILMAMLAVIAFTLFPSQIADQLSHANDQGEVSLHVGDWQTALLVIEAYPLFGVGLGTQAYLAISNFYRVPAQTVLLAEPDNSYLQWGAMAGIPVMLVFLLLLGFVFWFAWRNWLTVEARSRPLLGAGIVALLAISIISLSGDVWTSTTDVSHLGWLIAGVVTSPFLGRALHRQSAPSGDRMAEIVHAQTEEIFQIDEAKQSS